MGENIIIQHEQFSNQYTNTGLLICVYELTRTGPKDISSKVFGNITGENLVLPEDKVYLLGVSSMGNGTTQRCTREVYRHIWNIADSREEVRSFGATFRLRSTQGNISKAWKKDYNSNNQSEFFVCLFDMEAYASLATSTLTCITKPKNLSEEKFCELLEPYGGKDNFDVRPFLLKLYESSSGKGQMLDHIGKSRSYILPSPLFISSDQVPGMLQIAPNVLPAEIGRADLLGTRSLIKGTGTLTGLHQAYADVVAGWAALLRTVLSPNALILHLKNDTNSLRGELEKLCEEGQKSRPESRKLREIDKAALESTSARFIAPLNNITAYCGQIKEELQATDRESLRYALGEAAISTANRVCTVLNSTVYLARDIRKSCNLDLHSEVRWKGARKEKEKELAGWLHAIDCVLQTSPIFKDFLMTSFYAWKGRRTQYTPSYGLFLEGLTDRQCIIRLSREKFKKGDMANKWGDSTEFFKAAKEYLLFPDSASCSSLIETGVKTLENIVSCPSIKSTLEHGIQVAQNGALLTFLKNNLLISQLRGKLELYPVPNIEGKSFQINDYKDFSATGNTFLDDMYSVLALAKEHHIEIGLEDYVRRVCACVATLVELKYTVALKTSESYFFYDRALSYLRDTTWTRLLQ